MEQKPISQKDSPLSHLSVRQQLTHHLSHAQNMSETIDVLIQESHELFETIMREERECQNTPTDIQDNLITSFQNKEEKTINQNLAHQKSENN